MNSTWSHLANQHFGFKITTSYYRNRFDNSLADNQDFSKSERFRGEFQGDFEPSVHHSLTFGFEGTYDLVNGNFFGNREAIIVGSYLQDEFRVNDRIAMTGGLRFDYNSVVSGLQESQVSPKFGLIYNISEFTTLKGSVGTGFRAPSIAELFTETRAAGFQVIPNPDLEAENSWSAELGVSTTIGTHILINAAVYQERYFDFINPRLGFQDSLIIIFENVQDARIRGIETNISAGWLRNRLNVAASYVFVDPRDLQSNALLTYRPQHILTTSLTVKPGIFEFGADFRFASRLKREQLEVFPDDARVSSKIFDVRAAVSFGAYNLTFNVENLLQYHYTQVERTLQPNRQFSLTLQGDL